MDWKDTPYESDGVPGECLGFPAEKVRHKALKTRWEAVFMPASVAEMWSDALASIPGHLPVIALGDIFSSEDSTALLFERCDAPVLEMQMPEDPLMFFRILAEGVLTMGEICPQLSPLRLRPTEIHVFSGSRPRVGIRAFEILPAQDAGNTHTQPLYQERLMVLRDLAGWLAGRCSGQVAEILKGLALAENPEIFRERLSAADKASGREPVMVPSLVAVCGAPEIAVHLARVAAASGQGEVYLVDGDLMSPALDLLQPGEQEGRIFRIEGEEDVPGVPVLLALAARGRLDRQSLSGAGYEVRGYPGLRVFYGSMDPGQYEYYPETQWQELLEVMRRMAMLVVVSVPANPYDAFALSAMLQADRVLWAGGQRMADVRRNNRIISLLQKTQAVPAGKHLMIMTPDTGLAGPDRGTLKGVSLPEAGAWLEVHPKERVALAWGEPLPVQGKRSQQALKQLLISMGVLKPADKKWFRGGLKYARG